MMSQPHALHCQFIFRQYLSCLFWGQIAKYLDRQYFQPYGIWLPPSPKYLRSFCYCFISKPTTLHVLPSHHSGSLQIVLFSQMHCLPSVSNHKPIDIHTLKQWAIYATVGLMLDCINSFTLIRQTLYVVSHFTCSRSAKHLQNTSAALTLVTTSHL